MLLSAVSVLVVAQSSSEIPEVFMNNHVYIMIVFLMKVRWLYHLGTIIGCISQTQVQDQHSTAKVRNVQYHGCFIQFLRQTLALLRPKCWFCFRHTGGHVRLGRISLSGGGKHFIAARVHHRRQHRDTDLERLPTPVTGMKQLFMVRWFRYVPFALTFENCVLRTQCVYVFYVIIKLTTITPHIVGICDEGYCGVSVRMEQSSNSVSNPTIVDVVSDPRRKEAQATPLLNIIPISKINSAECLKASFKLACINWSFRK